MSELLDRYVDVKGAAGQLGVHAESVRRLIRKGHLPAVKIMGKWLVEKDVMAQFVINYEPQRGRRLSRLDKGMLF